MTSSGAALVPAPARAAAVSSSLVASLVTVPPEILDNIACFAAVTANPTYGDNLPLARHASSSATSSSDPGASASSSSRSSAPPSRGMLYDTTLRPSHVVTPPSDLLSLLLVCRRFHHLLKLENNPRLYARVFRSKFDTAAIQRRFGNQAVSSIGLASELKRRCLVLSRIRKRVLGWNRERSNPNRTTANLEHNDELVENLWTAYMMMLENDGLNLQQLRWGQIESYLAIHHTQVMLSRAVQPGYPADSVDRALALHLTYLLTDPEQLASESRDESDEKLFVLRPFVFAAHKFDAFLAPWTYKAFPLTRSQEGSQGDADFFPAGDGGGPRQPNNPFLADLTPRSRACTLEHCGRQLCIAAPVLSQGALFSFFIKVEKDPAVLGMGALLTSPEDVAAIENGEAGQHGLASGDPLDSVFGRHVVRTSSSRSPLSFTSADHDLDALRLLLCTSPLASPGLSPLHIAGTFQGTWEGRFSFFDFDSYREMLAGRQRSLYEGPFGEQPQIWKIKESIVKLGAGETPGGSGSVLSAGYLSQSEGLLLDEKVEESIGKGSRIIDREELLRIEGSNGNDLPYGEGIGRTGDRAANVGGLPRDWHRYPLFDDEDGRNPSQAERYEILLSGTGHSAWGRFVLRGRVRTWDGMLIMTKEYRPDGRGRWLYRGYSVAGGKLVGRWRDTFTPEAMSGYEGCFLLHRRETD